MLVWGGLYSRITDCSLDKLRTDENIPRHEMQSCLRRTNIFFIIIISECVSRRNSVISDIEF